MSQELLHNHGSVGIESTGDARRHAEVPGADVQPVADVQQPALVQSREAFAIKRTIDLVIAIVGLVVLTPLGVVIALAIRIASPGAVIFRQTRVGQNGTTFSMWKFRTMIHGAEQERAQLEPLNQCSGTFKLKDDPRLTAVGRLLRRASLDELPQLINVLVGEMSLVGPRPLVPDEDERIKGPFRARLLVKPGMTGPWQAIGLIRPPLTEMVVIDCLYVETWSNWTDVKIIARTLWHVLRLRGI